ncbi:CPBP family intramembrane metalloprotease [Candidatus Saccharibacteria bacterium]|nr:CPBP family intramembrane metalloprotease [Candidatus Saccharibacteria bacterium]
MFPRASSFALDWDLVITFAWQALVFVVGFFVLYAIISAVRKKLVTREELGLANLKWNEIGFGLLGTIVYFITAVFIMALARQVLPFVDWDQPQDVGVPSFIMGGNLLVAFFFLCIFIPFIEELIFRGLIFGRLRVKLGFILSATITSVLFAALHGQWNVAIDVFVLAMVASGAREITGNINASIIMHMLKNMLAFYIVFVT